MARHALHTPRRRSRFSPQVLLLAALTSVVLVVTVIVFDAVPSGVRTLAARAPLVGAHCPDGRLSSTTVSITVAPEVQATVNAALAPLATKTLAGRECVHVQVQAQEPSETIQSAQILPVDRAPDVWVPDSSLWISRTPRWQVKASGSFATSPVVIATSEAAINKLGWTNKPPTWLAALAGIRPVAVPEIAQDAAGLSAVITLWQALGKGDKAQQALAGAVLATGRAGVPTEQEALEAAESGSASAPLLPTSEQAVRAANLQATRSRLTLVRPSGGAPSLDYPVLTTIRPAPKNGTSDAAGSDPQARDRAVKAVVAQLLSSQAAGVARTNGFQASGSAPSPTQASDSATVKAASVSPIEGLTAPELAALVSRITALTAPSRVLVIFDLSQSMLSSAGNGMSRIQFAVAAASAGGNLLADRAQVGLWGFSRDLRGSQDIVKFEKVGVLGPQDESDGKRSHREQVSDAMNAAPHQLGGDGTALFSTAVAGMQEMTKLYDARAGNAVLLFTDGANDDAGGPSLQQTLANLHKLYDPKRPVRLICVGVGSDADMNELRQLASATDGLAYSAKDPKEMPQVMFEAMNRRTQ